MVDNPAVRSSIYITCGGRLGVVRRIRDHRGQVKSSFLRLYARSNFFIKNIKNIDLKRVVIHFLLNQTIGPIKICI
ncbi:hypothetical protein RIR_jg20076.t1 [Rhizophagus irregularis DAOM 181602=DAOM 197198]|nr:hypothetical protein RIR_jg20076.t1 [Rhizophagus irregularis DAOM 181602=DAOM 197198]